MYDLSCINIGEKLKEHRKIRNYTLQEVGEKVCKSRATIQKYEQGIIIPDIITVLELCNVLDIHLNQIIKEEKEDNNMNCCSIMDIFKTNKLYLYYLTGDKLITSIICCENNGVKMYNGLTDKMNKFAYYYEGYIETDGNTLYIQMHNSKERKILEKVQIMLNIPWIEEVDNCECFIMGLTTSGFPVVKKGIIKKEAIGSNGRNKMIERLRITKVNARDFAINNSWVLRQKDYAETFYEFAENY